jgi:hypothetical protein
LRKKPSLKYVTDEHIRNQLLADRYSKLAILRIQKSALLKKDKTTRKNSKNP